MNKDTQSWSIAWSHGHGQVQALGGMLGPVHFKIAPDRHVQPFAIFPWADEIAPADEPALEGLLKRGRGEWPCVPFGMPPESKALDWHHPIHGASANAHWVRMDDSKDSAFIKLRFDHDAASPLDFLERDIRGVQGQAEIHCRLTVHAKRECQLPLGLHPVLKLPTTPGMLRLLPGRFQFARSYPKEVEVGADIVQSNQSFQDLSVAPGRNGSSLNLLNYPLSESTESLIQLCGTQGQMAAINEEEHYQFELLWDAQVLPSCLLWISNGGRQHWPWNGRHFALGMEPICAYFDLGVNGSLNANPVSDQGVPTTLSIHPSSPLILNYVMRLSDASAHKP